MDSNFFVHPVGQGLFYSGHFFGDNHKIFNFVYDCGNCTSGFNKYGRKAVQSYSEMNDNNTIDLLAISHFHNDHISGIASLLKGFTLKKVVMPYIGPKTVYLVTYLIEICLQYGIKIEEILLLTAGAQENEISEDEFPREEGLKDFSEDDSKQQSLLDNEIEDGEVNDSKVQIRVCKTASFILKYTEMWEFNFFNLHTTNSNLLKLAKGIESIAKKYGTLELAINHELGLSDIKKLYDQIFKSKSFNATSLCCYHGPKKTTKANLNLRLRSFYGARNLSIHALPLHSGLFGIESNDLGDNIGTLLTGDIDLEPIDNYQQFHQHFSCVKNQVGVIFFPHHGSKKEWNDKLYKDFGSTNTIWIASCGIGNTYGHPNIGCIEKVLKGRDNMVLVSNEFQTIGYDVFPY